MRSQSVVVSAYMAVALLIVAMTTIYVYILPHTQTYLASYSSLNVKSIVYSRYSWTAKVLADELYSKLDLKYVYVNITVYNVTSGKVISIDYYIIRPIRNIGLTYVSYNLTNFDPDGIIYVYYIRVGR